MIKKFHEKLQEIIKNVNHMGKLVQEAVEGAAASLTEDNPEIAQKVIDGDDRIDDLEMRIEQDCLFIHAEYQPFAKDLRLINSMNIIAIYLERIGDLAVNLAKITRRLEKHKAMFMTPEILDLVREMARLAKTVLASALKALKNHDAKLAARLEEIDTEVDEIQKVIFKKLFASVADNDEINREEFALYLSNISLATRYLERIGDQSVNIGERVLIFLTGDYKYLHDDINEG
ncbi:MAG TPA: phosphate transport system regulatory protein PhoU [Actinobacteria bacterium]|nr:phosphate transport system regulatory protein PhoU [Actinomycetota bacterium]